MYKNLYFKTSINEVLTFGNEKERQGLISISVKNPN